MKQFNCKSWLARMLIGWGERGDWRCKGSNYFIMVGEEDLRFCGSFFDISKQYSVKINIFAAGSSASRTFCCKRFGFVLLLKSPNFQSKRIKRSKNAHACRMHICSTQRVESRFKR
jgi:hypothetical protein